MPRTFDYWAVGLAAIIAAAITATLWLAHRGERHRREWVAAGILAGVLLAAGLFDLLRVSPRETVLTTWMFGATLPVLGALGMIRGTRGVRTWIRLPLVYVTALVLLFGGLLIGATLVPRVIVF